MEPPTTRGLWPVLVLITLVIGLLLSGLNLFWGELNQDEGWYLYAARLVAEGQQPYRDFAFTQGPVFPAIYAWAHGWVERWGVMGGRLFTAGLGWIASLLAAAFAWRLTRGKWGPWAALLTFMLLQLNVYHSYFTLVVKTYALTAILIAAAALSLTFLSAAHRRWPAALAGLGFALAAGVRLSAGVWLPLVGLYFLARRKDFPGAWWCFGLGGLLGLLIAFASTFRAAPEEAWFWLVQYHALREAGSLTHTLIYSAGFISRFVQAYFVLLMLILAWLAGMRWAGQRWSAIHPFLGVFVLGVGGVTVVHLLAPFPYEDYQVIIMPVVAALAATGWVRWLEKLVVAARQSVWIPGTTILIGLLCIGSAFSSPRNQDWFISSRDRIWWPLKETADLRQLQAVGDWLRETVPADAYLLTMDTYIAVESGLRVLPGLEMGPFSYYPDWSDAKAEQRQVLNLNRSLERVESGAAAAALLSGYAWAIASPQIEPVDEADRVRVWEAVAARYDRVKTVPNFGQAYTPLQIWLRVDEEATGTDD